MPRQENTMTAIVRPKESTRTLLALAAGVIAIVALTVAVAARADSTPVGPLPAGPTSTITTGPNQLVAVALPHASRKSGLSWRLARRYDSNIVRQISEADVNTSTVLVFKVVGRGQTSLVFGLTRGDASAKAFKSATHKIVSR
jgi:hypothetical protein